jgi:hypothetical protein
MIKRSDHLASRCLDSTLRVGSVMVESRQPEDVGGVALIGASDFTAVEPPMGSFRFIG